MPLKVKFVFPSITGVGFGSYGKGMEESWISHGLSLISACVKKAGFDVSLADLRCMGGWKDFEKDVAHSSPDVLAVTMMSVDFNPAMKAIDIAKKINPEIITVVGGPHPSIMPEEVLAQEKIDYVIKGEGEISFVNLLKELDSGHKPSERLIEGIKPDLDALPFADRELFSSLEYPLPVKGFDSPFITIIAGRGCLYNCSFCQPAERKIFGPKVRRRSVDNVLEELEYLDKKYHFKSMMIHDDCLTEDSEWIYDFCKKYRKRFNQPFACQTRADIVCKNEEMIKEMRNSGLSLFFIGFESGNQRILNFLRKGTKVEHNYKAAEICRKYGIKIWANYMIGVPTETKEEVMDTVRMIKKIKPDHYSPAFYTPHPGSDLFTYCEEHNLSLVKSHDSYRRNATECKIKGIDYEFLFNALNESQGITEPLIKINKLNWLKEKVRPFFNEHPRIKKIVKKIIGSS
ncbi:MAG: radical SAM protein [Candidatus Schekmanbacteria bacterium]|nr:MAG: radical SAM protein [Candidatus Schekmanbacteria bacterium]